MAWGLCLIDLRAGRCVEMWPGGCAREQGTVSRCGLGAVLDRPASRALRRNVAWGLCTLPWQPTYLLIESLRWKPDTLPSTWGHTSICDEKEESRTRRNCDRL